MGGSITAIANGRLYTVRGDGYALYCFGQPPPNYPPYEPSNPDPEDGETDVPIDADLSWTGGDPNLPDIVKYDIYFGNNSPPSKVVSNQSGTIYDPGTMDYEQRYYWQIVAWDNHGVSTEGPIWNFTTIPDTTPPFITGVQATPSSQMPGECVNITTTVTDNVEVDMVYLYILYPDSSFENFSITQNKTGNNYHCNKAYDQLGAYTYHIWANDINGNDAVSADRTFEIILDTTPPGTTHRFNPSVPDGDNNWYVSDVTITLDATDNLSGVEFTYYRLNSGSWKTYTSPVVVSDDGEHTLEYYSVDFVGNEERIKGPFDFKIDQILPTITLAAERVSFGTYKLIADASDATSGVAKVEFYVNGEPVGTVTDAPYECEVSDCSRGDMATATVYDNAGHLKESNEVTSYSHSNQHIIFTFLERLLQRFPIFAFIFELISSMR
jgi:hypothetical protein